MKTISPKNAVKLFLFLLILFSAKAFSFTTLPNDASSKGAESKFGGVSKVKKAPAATYAAVAKRTAMPFGSKRFKK